MRRRPQRTARLQRHQSERLITPLRPAADFRIVFVTAGSRSNALVLARDLVRTRAAACVNVIPGVRSVYRWRGRVREDREWLLVVKTRASRLAKITELIHSLHTYDVPEILAVRPDRGDAGYLAWLSEETTERGRS